MSLKSASAAARHPNPGLTELLLQAMTLLATGIPARRVSRIDPMASLRWERNPCDSPLSSDPGKRAGRPEIQNRKGQRRFVASPGKCRRYAFPRSVSRCSTYGQAPVLSGPPQFSSLTLSGRMWFNSSPCVSCASCLRIFYERPQPGFIFCLDHGSGV
jgi:hypothetical protein